ncbi:MAG: response regulator transcription factor [Lachnospiraceae bacterium]|nr:response regulator transcription factor [Lachnospiraceae bacterium]
MRTVTQNILIVEDDNSISELLRETITKQGYTCEQAYSGTEAMLLLRMKDFSLVLLDLMIPGISGEEVLEKIREQEPNLPVMILTAKDTLDDKIQLLADGADDYIIKPFEIKEVLARIQVQLRHKSGEKESSRIEFRELVLDKSDYSITINGKKLAKITKQEFAIMELLLRHPKKVYSKEDIFECAWQEPYMGETKTLDVHISNIRKKIKEITEEEYIETIWGIGYRVKG